MILGTRLTGYLQHFCLNYSPFCVPNSIKKAYLLRWCVMITRMKANRVRMSHVDAAWLHAERPKNLVIIHGLLIFDEPLDMEKVYDVLQTRLIDKFPRFRRRVIQSQRSGAAWWEDVPSFDVRDQVEQVVINEPLPAYLGRLMSRPLDFSRPLWRIYAIDGINEDKSGSAIFVRAHHVLGDGIALTRVLLSMTDGGTYPLVLKQPDMSKSRKAMFLAGLRGIGILFKLLFKLPDNNSVFKGEMNIDKKVAWSRPIPLSDIKSLREATGGTVNDVLLTVLSGALRKYAQCKGGSGNKNIGSIRATVPVNLRPLDGDIKLGNKFGIVFLTLPLDLDDPMERMKAIKARMTVLKRSPEPVVTYGLLDFFGRNPPPLIRLYFKLFSMKATAVMTNVPCSTTEVGFAGTPLKQLMFWVPQPSGLGLGISIMSYNGNVFVGVATDGTLIPDPQNIIEQFHAEFEQLLVVSK